MGDFITISAFILAITSIFLSALAFKKSNEAYKKLNVIEGWGELASLLKNLLIQVETNTQKLEETIAQAENKVSTIQNKGGQLMDNILEATRRAENTLSNMESLTEEMGKPGSMEKYRLMEIQTMMESGIEKEEIAKKLQVPLGELELLLRLHNKKQ